jgi:hypothetical protein
MRELIGDLAVQSLRFDRLKWQRDGSGDNPRLQRTMVAARRELNDGRDEPRGLDAW